MTEILETVRFIGGCASVIVVAFLVMLALPKCKLRSMVMEIGGWVMVGLCALYVVSPIDVIPDFIAGFGFTDDATVLYAAIRSVAGHIRDEHRVRAKQMLDRALAD